MVGGSPEGVGEVGQHRELEARAVAVLGQEARRELGGRMIDRHDQRLGTGGANAIARRRVHYLLDDSCSCSLWRCTRSTPPPAPVPLPPPGPPPSARAGAPTRPQPPTRGERPFPPPP